MSVMSVTLEVIKNLTRGIETFKIYSDMLKYAKENYVMVGIPLSKTLREENPETDVNEEMTNAGLLYLHTNGSPIKHIPKRPVIEPALENDNKKLSSMLKKSMEDFVSYGEEVASKDLEKLGMEGQNAVREWFVDPRNGWPPNSPKVQEEKRKKKATDPKPLIDTGELRKSITYVVVKDGERNG